MKFSKDKFLCKTCNNAKFYVEVCKDQIILVCSECGKTFSLTVPAQKKSKRIDSAIVLITSKIDELEEKHRRLVYRVEELEQKINNLEQ